MDISQQEIKKILDDFRQYCGSLQGWGDWPSEFMPEMIEGFIRENYTDKNNE